LRSWIGRCRPPIRREATNGFLFVLGNKLAVSGYVRNEDCRYLALHLSTDLTTWDVSAVVDPVPPSALIAVVVASGLTGLARRGVQKVFRWLVDRQKGLCRCGSDEHEPNEPKQRGWNEIQVGGEPGDILMDLLEPLL
jgi:hypothetical protein